MCIVCEPNPPKGRSEHPPPRRTLGTPDRQQCCWQRSYPMHTILRFTRYMFLAFAFAMVLLAFGPHNSAGASGGHTEINVSVTARSDAFCVGESAMVEVVIENLENFPIDMTTPQERLIQPGEVVVIEMPVGIEMETIEFGFDFVLPGDYYGMHDTAYIKLPGKSCETPSTTTSTTVTPSTTVPSTTIVIPTTTVPAPTTTAPIELIPPISAVNTTTTTSSVPSTTVRTDKPVKELAMTGASSNLLMILGGIMLLIGGSIFFMSRGSKAALKEKIN